VGYRRSASAADPGAALSEDEDRSRQDGVRLWSLLHAQALLRGPAGGPGDAAWIEDDGRRLAARRAG